MNTNLLNNNDITVYPDNVLKVTALNYLAEALNNEEYEKCAELVHFAKAFGAKPTEVKAIIIVYGGTYDFDKVPVDMLKLGGRLKRY